MKSLMIKLDLYVKYYVIFDVNYVSENQDFWPRGAVPH